MKDCLRDSEYEEQKARVQEHIEFWMTHVGLGWWTITMIWHQSDSFFRDSGVKKRDGVVIARCYPDWAYRRGAIHWNLAAFEDLNDEEAELAVVHEFMHFFVDEVKADHKNDTSRRDEGGVGMHEERVCETLARGFVWLKEHYEKKLKAKAGEEVQPDFQISKEETPAEKESEPEKAVYAEKDIRVAQGEEEQPRVSTADG